MEWGGFLGVVSRELPLQIKEITRAFQTKVHKSKRMKRKQDPDPPINVLLEVVCKRMRRERVNKRRFLFVCLFVCFIF